MINQDLHSYAFDKKINFKLLLVWLLFTSVEPFQFYAVIPYHPYKFLVFFLLSIIFFFLLKNLKDFKFSLIPTVIIAQIFYSVVSVFIHFILVDSFFIEDAVIYFNLVFQLIVILFLYFFIYKYINFQNLAISFINVISVLAIFGMFSVVLIYFFDISPISYTQRLENRDISNFILTFSTGRIDEVSSSIIRSSGYFDEPGTFGFYIVICLVLNKIYDYSKSVEKILLFMGFCTLSLAFMISVFLYLIIFGLLEGKILFVSFLISFFILVFSVINFLKDENSVYQQLYELTIYRLESGDNEDRIVNGDNRSENLRFSIEAFKAQPFFGFGMNAHINPKTKFYGRLCCNPMHPLATEGIFGFLIYFSIFIFWSFLIFNSRKIDFVLIGCWLIVIVNLIQRPGFIAGPFGYFAVVLLYEATKWRKNRNNLN